MPEGRLAAFPCVPLGIPITFSLGDSRLFSPDRGKMPGEMYRRHLDHQTRYDATEMRTMTTIDARYYTIAHENHEKRDRGEPTGYRRNHRHACLTRPTSSCSSRSTTEMDHPPVLLYSAHLDVGAGSKAERPAPRVPTSRRRLRRLFSPVARLADLKASRQKDTSGRMTCTIFEY